MTLWQLFTGFPLVRSPDPNNSLYYTLLDLRVIRVRGGDPIWAANENILLEFSAPELSWKLGSWNYRCCVHHLSKDWCLDDLVYQEESEINHLWWCIFKTFAPFRICSCSTNLYHSWISKLTVKRFLNVVNAVKLLRAKLLTAQWKHFVLIFPLDLLFLFRLFAL